MVSKETAFDFREEGLKILEEQRRGRRIHQGKLVLSWIGLLLFLAVLFSGQEFQIGEKTIRFIQLDSAFIQEYGLFIGQGIGQTLLISVVSIAFAIVLALISALMRLSRSSPAVALSTFYVSLVRGTPLYLQIIFIFLALPQMGIQLSGFWSGVTALSLNYGAYMSEIFRAGILAVGKGQHEAATALGMSPGEKLRLIVLPQALRFAIPPIGNEFIAMLKDSSLVSITGFVHEVLWRAQRVGRANFRNLEALLIAASFYWALTLIFSAFQARLETRLARGDDRKRFATH